MGRKISGCTSASKDTQILGRFFTVDNLKKKRLIKPSPSNPRMCVLTAKGRTQLQKKRKEFPFVSGSKR